MNILFISPTDAPINKKSKYVGIERLVWEYSRELIKSHKVTVIGHQDSDYADGVCHLPAFTEVKAYQEYSYLYRNFDVIHDFSHLHLASRFIPGLPSLNIIWHDPGSARYPKSPYNIISPSQWGVREFKRVYKQEAKYMQIIAIDPDIYKPYPSKSRGDRYLTLGRMAEEKGNFLAAQLCKKAGVKLDIAGGRGIGVSNTVLTDYELSVLKLCDGKQVKFLGEVEEDEKVKLMKSCKALLYATRFPEITGHKYQEALMCGCPIILRNVGSANEFVEMGFNGYLCHSDEDFIRAIEGMEKSVFDCDAISKKAHEVYSVPLVIAQHVTLYEEVANGKKW